MIKHEFDPATSGQNWRNRFSDPIVADRNKADALKDVADALWQAGGEVRDQILAMPESELEVYLGRDISAEDKRGLAIADMAQFLCHGNYGTFLENLELLRQQPAPERKQ